MANILISAIITLLTLIPTIFFAYLSLRPELQAAIGPQFCKPGDACVLQWFAAVGTWVGAATTLATVLYLRSQIIEQRSQHQRQLIAERKRHEEQMADERSRHKEQLDAQQAILNQQLSAEQRPAVAVARRGIISLESGLALVRVIKETIIEYSLTQQMKMVDQCENGLRQLLKVMASGEIKDVEGKIGVDGSRTFEALNGTLTTIHGMFAERQSAEQRDGADVMLMRACNDGVKEVEAYLADCRVSCDVFIKKYG